MTPVATHQQYDAAFARDIRNGLTHRGQRELPSTYFYDGVGSALFEAITQLDAYGLTRADERVIRQLAPVLPTHFAAAPLIAELGSGSGRKTRHLLQAFGDVGARPVYFPIDVSATALMQCAAELSAVADVTAVENTYLDGLASVVKQRRPGQPLLLLFLGSTIGNFSPDDAMRFLAGVRGLLSGGDALLLGADLVKPVSQMLLAYDDPAGVTAAFNRNLLVRINRELDADFQLPQWAHEARYDQKHRRIEMHLRSLCRQRVVLPGADLEVSFEQGETIWTESSHKFNPDELDSLAKLCGFQPGLSAIDNEWPFVETLWTVERPAS